MQTTTEAQRLGVAAENLAERHLVRQGLEPLARNFRVSGGEIDLIMREHDTLVFVEVRFRSHQAFGGASASVQPRKQRRLIHAAQHYLQRFDGPEPPCRFDVVSVRPGSKPGMARVAWIPDAFSA